MKAQCWPLFSCRIRKMREQQHTFIKSILWRSIGRLFTAYQATTKRRRGNPKEKDLIPLTVLLGLCFF